MSNRRPLNQDQISELTEALRSKLVETRRDIYMHPELSGQEERTAGVVAKRLQEMGAEVSTGVAGYGVIGLLHGGKEGGVVAIRCDMDAVKIQDVLTVPYKSQVPGVKHVCGHDVHSTIALGVAEVLASIRERQSGSVKFIFQPAEETATGARDMIDAGVLENPRPQAIFALHTFPMPAGQLGYVPGIALIGEDSFSCRLTMESDGTAGRRDVLESVMKRCNATLSSLNP